MTIKIEKSGGKARFKANDQEFLVADEGNVGIGTDSPAAKLDVAGLVKVSSLITKGGLEVGTSLSLGQGRQTLAFGGELSNGQALYGLTRNGEAGINTVALAGFNGVSLRTKNSEKVRITANGNVGIGTNSPATKLHVNGDATINGVTISSLIARIEALEAGN